MLKLWSMRPIPATAVSLPMYLILTISIVGWVIYGLKINSKPVWLANGLTLILTLATIAYKNVMDNRR
jgi:MtN3 and saliva related transmembrane protein